MEHTRVEIILAATGKLSCPVVALRRLFLQDPHPSNAPFFRLQFSAFYQQAIINILKEYIMAAGPHIAKYSGHSFQKKVAQYAANHDMLDENIQKLSYWISNIFKPYFTTSPQTLFNLNLSFQKVIPLAVFSITVQAPILTSLRGPKPWL